MDVHAGVKISPDEYFERQKNAENVCRKKLKRLIIQFAVFFALSWLFFVIVDIFENFFIVWYLFDFICLFLAFGSLIMIPRTIRYYKYSLDRIAEYMLSGGIVINIPQEDYEKFDVFKSKKDKYKAKSVNQLKKDELKRQNELKAEEERKEYERQIDEEFRKQYYSDSSEE